MLNRVDSILSHSYGKVKAVRARLSGLVGVFAYLTEQHGELLALMQRARVNNAKFTELWPTIRVELISHEQAEDRELYAVLRGRDATRALADHHATQVAELEHLIGRVDALSVGTPEHAAVFRRLREAVIRHVHDEERDTFPRAQQALGKDHAESLATAFRRAKKNIAELL
jgi:hypothetical protein